ncbi:MAG: DUF45 domain-containing protein [Candidatus Cloacimonetes bacterium]|nr:DUF45 domain-containing protein [Candidatus Cloacimonadota bacterium]
MVKEIKGVYRKKIKKWYKEFKIKIENNAHLTQALPKFRNIDFYINSDADPFARCYINSMEIEIAKDFLEAFGDKEDCVKFMLTHEFCHFLVLGHGKDFSNLMRQAGYTEDWLWNYTDRKYDWEFFQSRYSNDKVVNPLNENVWCIK